MESSVFSSPRAGCFPAGLRVLVVDDDSTWLKILEKMLKKCNYEVRVCNLAQEALDLLRERKDRYDIVISDVNMPDMDGFKLLEHVGLEMDLPVIMMSVDGETSRVMKGVQHGACDYLLKPIRMKELRNIWQHVFRKRMHEVRDIEGQECLEELHFMSNGAEKSDDCYLFTGDFSPGKKRKDTDNKHDDKLCGDTSSTKKPRVVWTVDLHQKFVKAVNQIGLDKVGPKKVLDLMGVTWLSRENVASHLQKYRLYLSRLEQENELKAALGRRGHTEFNPKDPSANVCLQNAISPNSLTVSQNTVTNKGRAAPAHKNLDDPVVCENNVKGILSTPMTKSKKALFEIMIDPPGSDTSRMSFSHPFGPRDPKVKPEPKILAEYSWRAGAPSTQFNQKLGPCNNAEHVLNPLPQPMHQIQVGSAQPSLFRNPTASEKQELKPTVVNTDLSYGNSRGQSIGKSTKLELPTTMFPIQPQSHLAGLHAFEQMPYSIWSTKNHNSGPNPFDVPGSSQRNLNSGVGTTFGLWDEEYNWFSAQGDFHQLSADFGSIRSFGCTNEELISDIPPHLHDSLNFGCDYACEQWNILL